MPLLARYVRIPVRPQDRIDDAGEALQLRPPDRLRPTVARRSRIAQHLLYCSPVNAEPPHKAPRYTSTAPGHNRQGTMNAGEFSRRRNRTVRPLRVGHYADALNTHFLSAKWPQINNVTSPNRQGNSYEERFLFFRSPSTVQTLLPYRLQSITIMAEYGHDDRPDTYFW